MSARSAITCQQVDCRPASNSSAFPATPAAEDTPGAACRLGIVLHVAALVSELGILAATFTSLTLGSEQTTVSTFLFLCASLLITLISFSTSTFGLNRLLSVVVVSARVAARRVSHAVQSGMTSKPGSVIPRGNASLAGGLEQAGLQED